MDAVFDEERSFFFWRREAGTTAAFPGTYASYVARSCARMRDAFERLLRHSRGGGIAWLSRCDVVGIHVDPNELDPRGQDRTESPPSANGVVPTTVTCVPAISKRCNGRGCRCGPQEPCRCNGKGGAWGGFPPRSLWGRHVSFPRSLGRPPGQDGWMGGRPWDVFRVSWTNQSTVWIPAGYKPVRVQDTCGGRIFEWRNVWSRSTIWTRKKC